MEWFENKTTQVIALVGIIGTLAGFGYTGATYVNRLENLEAQIGGIGDTENAQKIIEERFASIETSVDYINKSIEGGINPSLNVLAENANEIGKDVAALATDIEYLQEDVDTLKSENKNPLAN
jgi:archaellum component FlaC|tara:strand:- start:409 stop:777 length:369 start_codon:yes stop_codon:yes gene_type:complete